MGVENGWTKAIEDLRAEFKMLTRTIERMKEMAKEKDILIRNLKPLMKNGES